MKAQLKSSTVVPLPRKVSRDQRRQQLIDATMRVLSRKGYSQTTLSDVAAEARVSHGLVNFHFESKEKLLTATLLFMAEEYRQNWQAALAKAGDDPVEQLSALLAADFNDDICKPERLACWCSFWGEVQSRPLYQQECSANDKNYIQRLEGICAAIIRQGNYSVDAVRVARVLRFTSEGLWNDMLSMTKPYTREEAIETLFSCAAGFFPRHFPVAGPLRSNESVT
jgi:TetR/AcrR family transcriptional repressor of bet genes